MRWASFLERLNWRDERKSFERHTENFCAKNKHDVFIVFDGAKIDGFAIEVASELWAKLGLFVFPTRPL